LFPIYGQGCLFIPTFIKENKLKSLDTSGFSVYGFLKWLLSKPSLDNHAQQCGIAQIYLYGFVFPHGMP